MGSSKRYNVRPVDVTACLAIYEAVIIFHLGAALGAELANIVAARTIEDLAAGVLHFLSAFQAGLYVPASCAFDFDHEITY
jgi:hypothetical protein